MVRRLGAFVEFEGENGIRYLARISAIQMASDVDEMAAESYVTIAGRTILVRQPLDQWREALCSEQLTRLSS